MGGSNSKTDHEGRSAAETELVLGQIENECERVIVLSNQLMQAAARDPRIQQSKQFAEAMMVFTLCTGKHACPAEYEAAVEIYKSDSPDNKAVEEATTALVGCVEGFFQVAKKLNASSTI